MKKENAFILAGTAGEQYDDISVLRDAFSLGGFRYTDIAREDRLAGIIARWPLLHELSYKQRENNG